MAGPCISSCREKAVAVLLFEGGTGGTVGRCARVNSWRQGLDDSGGILERGRPWHGIFEGGSWYACCFGFPPRQEFGTG
jgi:hypothetical protein